MKILDAYRPIRAQKRFWEIMPNDDFIARPPDMTKIKKFRPTHMNGMCVDVTLTDKEGNEILVPDTNSVLIHDGEKEGGNAVSHEQKKKVEDDQTPDVPAIFAAWKVQEGIAW